MWHGTLLTSCWHRGSSRRGSARWCSAALAAYSCRPGCWRRWCEPHWGCNLRRSTLLKSKSTAQSFCKSPSPQSQLMRSRQTKWQIRLQRERQETETRSNTWGHVLGGHDGELPALEDNGAVWGAGVVEQTGHQVDAGPEMFRRWGSEIL